MSERVDGRLGVFCCGLALLLTGCGPEEAPGEARGPTDIPQRAGRVALTLGSGAGETSAFQLVSGLAQDASGRIYVVDARAARVHVFGPGGEPVMTFGGPGEDPGLLSDPCCLAFAPDGLLWVRDAGNARYSAFRVQEDAAEFVESRPLAHGDVTRWAALTFDSAGRLIDVGTGVEPGTSEPRLGRFRLGAGGEVVEQEILETPGPEQLGAKLVTVAAGADTARLYFSPPFGRQYLTAHGPGGRWAEAYNSAYEVRVHGPEGSVGMVRGPRLRGPPLAAAERQRAQQRLEEDQRRASLDLGFVLPERKQPLQAIYFDSDGRLWVELSAPEGAERRADVFGSDGRLLEHRTWPAAIELGLPGWIGGNTALGVASDSLAVQRVVRVAW